jgi:hypothetical protein
MYYKLINNQEEIPIDNLDFLKTIDEEVKKYISILCLSNPEHSKLNKIEVLRELPDLSSWSNLISLKVNWHKISVFPELPIQIEWVELNTNLIYELPNDLYKYENLEVLGLKDNNIEEFNIELPQYLRTLNVSFNKLKRFDKVLPNDFGQLDISYNFISELPNYIMNHECQKILHHNEGKFERYYIKKPINFNNIHIPNQNNNGIIGLPPIVPNNKLIYDNKQNVHNHEIQESIRKSIKNLVKKIKEQNNGTLPDYDTVNEIYNIILTCYKSKHQKYMKEKVKDNVLYNVLYFFNFRIKLKGKYLDSYKLIKEWCNKNYTHAGIEYNYTTILNMIIYIIKQKSEEEQLSIVDILVDETEASKMVCTTGKFSRLINVLNGFDDSIVIELSDIEIINNRLLVIRNKYEESKDTKKAREEASKMLEDFDITSIEKIAYIESIEY